MKDALFCTVLPVILLDCESRKELDNIYEAIAALSVKVPEARKQPRPIGFKLPKEEK